MDKPQCNRRHHRGIEHRRIHGGRVFGPVSLSDGEEGEPIVAEVVTRTYFSELQAVRKAVGAPLRRLARQLVSEAALLVASGTLVGVLVSMWLAVEAPFLAGAPWRAVSPLDLRVLGMIAGLMLLLTALDQMPSRHRAALAPRPAPCIVG